MKKTINPKDLKNQVERIHRSTKTTFSYFQPIHDKLRGKFKFYYYWHTLSFSEYVHIFIFSLAVLGFFWLSFTSVKIWRASKFTHLTYTLVGQRNWENFEKSANIVFEKGNILLAKQDEEYAYLGILEIKIDAQEEVIWDKVSFTAEIPPSCKIKLRTKVSNEDKPESWERISWSDFYEKPENKILYSGGINPKTRYLILGIILESEGFSTPRLSRVDISYVIKEPPSKIVLWIQDKLRKYLPIIFEKIYERYNEFGFFIQKLLFC